MPSYIRNIELGHGHCRKRADKSVGNEHETEAEIEIPEYKPVNVFEEVIDEHVPRRPMQFLFRQSGKVLNLAIQEGEDGSSRLVCASETTEKTVGSFPQHS